MDADDQRGQLAAELESVAERLADLALDALRSAVDPDDPQAAGAAQLERRLTRARRAVEKAAGLLSGADTAGGED